MSLICSASPSDRKFAHNKIVEIRGNREYGDVSVRQRITPSINLNATSLIELIPWDKNVYEPIYTCSYSKAELKQFLETPFDPPKFSAHTQATERAVKDVTEASEAVYGEEARDAFIRSRNEHRASISKVSTKKDLMKTFDI